jgi:hypothetical protein
LNILIVLSEEYKSRSSSLCNFHHLSITSSLYNTNILLSTLFSKTLSLYSSVDVRHQVLKPYTCRTTGKITVLYILIFTFFYSRQVNRSFLTEW